MIACISTHIESLGSKWQSQGVPTKTTRHMGLTIMQAGKNFQSKKLQRIFRGSKVFRRIFVKHMNNWDERILNKCEDLTARFFMRKELQGSNSKDFRDIGEYFEASCSNKSDEE